MLRTHRGACSLCEAICGLTVEIDGERIVSIKGDVNDPHSKGFVCPKALALKDLYEDPDRLRTPLIKRNGVFEQATWDEAYAEIARRLPPLG